MYCYCYVLLLLLLLLLRYYYYYYCGDDGGHHRKLNHLPRDQMVKHVAIAWRS